MPMGDENTPYRARFPGLSVTPDDDNQTSRDEQEFSTLEAAYLDLKRDLDTIDHWSAFDLDEKTAGLTIKQQVKAHRLAYEILAPIEEMLRTALANVNEKYREK